MPISAAIHATTEETVVAQTWKIFQTKAIKDRHINPLFSGRKLTYYEQWDTKSQSPDTLLATLDGQCAAFAQLFAVSIRAAGATTTVIKGVQVGSINRLEVMLINDWRVFGAGTSNDPIYRYQNTLADPTKYPTENTYKQGFDSFIRKNADNVWEYYWGNKIEVADEIPGVAGQNTPNPKSTFSDHWLIEISGEFYDPSYGTGPFCSRQCWEAESVAGFTVLSKVANTVNDYRLIFRENFAAEDTKDLDTIIVP